MVTEPGVRPAAPTPDHLDEGIDSEVRRLSPSGSTSVLRGLVRELRPRQWTKNVLVFVAPVAAGALHHGHQTLEALAAFALFCLAASGTYLLNDVADVEADRHHPEKRHRPVAAGVVPESLAAGVGVVMVGASIGLSWLLAGWPLGVIMASYVAISVAYTLRLKREPVIELAAVASGFVLRAIAGAAATHVPLSNWFLVVTSFGALFIVTGKRTAEHRLLGEQRANHRQALSQYTPTFLQSTLILTAGVTVTAYCLWAFEKTGLITRAGHRFVWIELSVVPVILGMLHVLRLLDAGKGGAPEELVFSDRLLQVLGLLWVLMFAIGLYG
jgi:decaprenyl-phosphate phosphoribosyltransferase